jgi:pimeloyl-ACP methyl ester carboxylesterase
MLLAYDDYGPGPVVVLLHGFPLNRSMWRGQEAALGSAYRLIAPDLRGHGETAAPEGVRVYPIDAMADDLIELLDELEIREPVVLGGLSMGGYVALSAVLRYPGRFRGLILMDTRAAADTPEAARNRETTASQVEATGKTDAVVEGMLAKLFSPVTRQRQPHLIDEARAEMSKIPARAVAGALRGMAVRPDRTQELPGLALPSLVLVGADDVITPPDESRAMVSDLPDARLAVIPEAGHLAPLENPEACNRAILAFLEALA